MSTSAIRAFVPAGSPGEVKRSRSAIDAYCAARGWPQLTSADYFDSNESTGGLAAIAQTLVGGDVLVLPSVKDVSDRPSVQERVILGLLARGIRLHVLSLGGPVEPHLLALREAWDATRTVEQRVDEMAKLMQEQAESHIKEMEDFQAEVVSQMAVKFGVGQLFKDGPENVIGKWIREQREARGMTQLELAERIGTTKQSISRAELSGRSDFMPQLLALFAPTPNATPATQENSHVTS